MNLSMKLHVDTLYSSLNLSEFLFFVANIFQYSIIVNITDQLLIIPALLIFWKGWIFLGWGWVTFMKKPILIKHTVYCCTSNCYSSRLELNPLLNGLRKFRSNFVKSTSSKTLTLHKGLNHIKTIMKDIDYARRTEI